MPQPATSGPEKKPNIFTKCWPSTALTSPLWPLTTSISKIHPSKNIEKIEAKNSCLTSIRNSKSTVPWKSRRSSMTPGNARPSGRKLNGMKSFQPKTNNWPKKQNPLSVRFQEPKNSLKSIWVSSRTPQQKYRKAIWSKKRFETFGAKSFRNQFRDSNLNRVNSLPGPVHFPLLLIVYIYISSNKFQ